MAAQVRPTPTPTPAVSLPNEVEEGKEMCKTLYKRELANMDIDELYDLLLHLVTFGIWEIDPETGVLSACGRAGGYGDVFKRLACPESSEIHVVGFTNFVSSNTIFTDFTTLRKAIQKYYTEWRKLSSPEQKRVADYVSTYLADFQKSSLSASDIKTWSLIRIREFIPTPYQIGGTPLLAELKATPQAGYKYELTFISRENYEFTWVFNPKDKVYFCKYDPNLCPTSTTELYSGKKQAIQKMCNYPTEDRKVYCPEAKEMKEVKINTYVDDIVNHRVPNGQWKMSKKDRMWTANGYKNGILVGGVKDYFRGIPSLNPRNDDNKGLRLVEIELISQLTSTQQLWRLKLAQTNRFTTPTINVYADNDTNLFNCCKDIILSSEQCP